MSNNKGFTVLELLIVLAVVGVLSALLFTSLRAAGETMGKAKCVSNLRNLGRTSLTFFQENDGNLFPTTFWFYHEPFTELLGINHPLVGLESRRDTILTCPSFQKKYPALFPSNLNRCYSLNYFAHSHRPQDEQSAALPSEWGRLSPGNIRSVRKPSAMWMFSDGAVGDSFVFTYYYEDHLPYMSLPHEGKQHAVFFDGHVAPITAEDMGKPVSSDFWGGPTTE